MFIELYRAWVPEHMHEDTCGVCGHTIAPASVIASLATDDRYDMGSACSSCVEYLGSRNPAKSPTIEFYREMLTKYPDPMYASDEALRAAAEEYEDPSEIAYEASWLWRARREDVPA